MKMGKSYKKIWPNDNLKEVVTFLTERHCGNPSLASVADRLGMNAKGVSRMLCKDDMKLSKAEEIARKYGYRLILHFPPCLYPTGEERPVRDCPYTCAGNLSGLVRYVFQRCLNIETAVSVTGCSRGILIRAFQKGDIMIGTMLRITEALNITVFWEWIPEEDNTPQY